MESRVPSRWDLKFVVITLVCILGAASGSYLLWRDLNGVGAAGQGVPMARVEKREAKVKRKPKSSYVWSNVQLDDNLYRRDSVQTSSGSAAALRLTDGSLLEMGENSLVIIDDIGNLSLNFSKGEVILRKSDGAESKLRISQDGKTSFEDFAIRIVKPESLARYFIFANGQKHDTTTVEFNWKNTAAAQNISGSGFYR